MASTRRVKAVAVVQGDGDIRGSVTFEEARRRNAIGKRTIKVVVDIQGLPAGKHGFHIHRVGDLRHGCESLCEHFNPDGNVHGGRADHRSHVGDLGNIYANQDGNAYEVFQNTRIQLRNTKYNIIGRSVVIHQDEDDLGFGGDAESLSTGNAGRRIACAVIGYANDSID